MSLEFSAQKWQMYRDQFYSAAFTIPDATHPVFSCQGCHWNLQKLSLPGHSWGNACSAQSCIRFQFSPRWSSAVADRISPLVCVQRSWKQQKLCLIWLLQEWALETEQKPFLLTGVLEAHLKQRTYLCMCDYLASVFHPPYVCMSCSSHNQSKDQMTQGADFCPAETTAAHGPSTCTRRSYNSLTLSGKI